MCPVLFKSSQVVGSLCASSSLDNDEKPCEKRAVRRVCPRGSVYMVDMDQGAHCAPGGPGCRPRSWSCKKPGLMLILEFKGGFAFVLICYFWPQATAHWRRHRLTMSMIKGGAGFLSQPPAPRKSKFTTQTFVGYNTISAK